MRTPTIRSALLLVGLGLAEPGVSARAGEGPPADWDRTAATAYLDSRQQAWSGFASADRGTGANKTSCVSCHTALPYALARPALRKLAGATEPTPSETRLLEHIKKRVAAWDVLDTPEYRLFYDFNESKKKESRGTEAVLNALVLAVDDRSQGRPAPSDPTMKALSRLWETQLLEGERTGAWDWLDFGLEPWESKKGSYFGAALAAIAVGTAPGYYTPGTDAALDRRVGLLKDYLKGNLAVQGDYNRIWVLWASTELDGLLDASGRDELIDRLMSKRSGDGGWSLSSLGNFTRSDETPQEAASDGNATGLILYVFQRAGLGRDDPKVAPGLAWLRANQEPSGAWRGHSVNQKRDPASSDPRKAHIGKFMSDAATAYAVLSLCHGQ